MGNKKETEETYNGAIWVKFDGLPCISLVSVILKEKLGWFQRVAEATRRRLFTLEEDWQIQLGRITYKPELNGTITIPHTVGGEKVVFDGASVPLPWLVSFLSIGILRPLGVMLIASILHDFAFKFGYLLVSTQEGDVPKKVMVERQDIDHLFRDIIATVNQVAGVGWVAWFFVRLGWLFCVKYNGQYFGGKAPVGVITIASVVVFFLVGYLFEGFQFQQARLEFLVTFLVLLYLLFYAAIVLVLKIKKIRSG